MIITPQDSPIAMHTILQTSKFSSCALQTWRGLEGNALWSVLFCCAEISILRKTPRKQEKATCHFPLSISLWLIQCWKGAARPGSRTDNSILAAMTNFVCMAPFWDAGNITTPRACWRWAQQAEHCSHWHCSWYMQHGDLRSASVCSEHHRCASCQYLKQRALALLEKTRMNDSVGWVYNTQHSKMSPYWAIEAAHSNQAVALELKEMGLLLLSQCNPLRLIWHKPGREAASCNKLPM